MPVNKSPRLPAVQRQSATPLDPDALARLIAGAPDSGVSASTNQSSEAPLTAQPPKRTRKGNRVQISHTLMEDLLERIDEGAKALGMSRAAFLNLGAIQLLERGAVIEGTPRKQPNGN